MAFVSWGSIDSGNPLEIHQLRDVLIWDRDRSAASAFGSHSAANVFPHRTWNKIMYSLLYLLQDFF
jgi:hypothetical protein